MQSALIQCVDGTCACETAVLGEASRVGKYPCAVVWVLYTRRKNRQQGKTKHAAKHTRKTWGGRGGAPKRIFPFSLWLCNGEGGASRARDGVERRPGRVLGSTSD